MAKTRGRDWGLPESGNRQSAATRPILIECYNDRLVILGESASELPKEIRLHEKTQESMDEFVSDVWTHMKGWGPAGKGLYWKPTLWMDVRPGAADRFAEIKTLLDGSGLEVHEAPAACRPQDGAREENEAINPLRRVEQPPVNSGFPPCLNPNKKATQQASTPFSTSSRTSSAS